MNLVKAYIVGGACKGATMWVDKDSSLTHWNQGTAITTYKTYDFYNGRKHKDNIGSNDFHARIKKEFIELIEEEPKPDTASNKNSMFETLITEYGNQPVFSVITDEGEMMRGDITFEQCKELINEYQDYDSEFEIVMKIMETETETVKQTKMKPTI